MNPSRYDPEQTVTMIENDDGAWCEWADMDVALLQLNACREFIDALRKAGVEEWTGYRYAVEEYERRMNHG